MQLAKNDVRVEVQVAFMIENQTLTLDDVIIKPEGTFRRSYSDDVLEINESNINSQKCVTIHLSREGLYDMLPEGLFHEATQKSVKETKEATKESEGYRKEEKAARLFFLPLEQEFYRQRIWLDNIELKYWLHSTQSEDIKMLERFWKINPKHFSQRQRLAVLSVLPHLHHVVGNLPLTAQCLRAIIGERLQVCTAEAKLQVVEENLVSCLGDLELGIDSVLGTSWYDDELSIHVNIGPVKRDMLVSFLPDGRHYKLLSTLYKFFFSAELEVETKIEALDEEAEFLLTDVEFASRLGYSTVI